MQQEVLSAMADANYSRACNAGLNVQRRPGRSGEVEADLQQGWVLGDSKNHVGALHHLRSQRVSLHQIPSVNAQAA